jgi:hypothetical protein
MRTWAHLPTYNDEVMFYQSNIWNFPNSEIAFANLGVVYLKCNLTGSAMDMWQISCKINPDYDVGYYNIHSIIKKQGDLAKASEMLTKAVNSKGCHFKEQWAKELVELNHEIEFIKEFEAMRVQLDTFEKLPDKKDQAHKLREQLEAINQIKAAMDTQRQQQLTLVQQEESTLRAKMIIVEQAKKQLVETPIEQLIKIRDMNFNNLKMGVKQLNEKNGSGIQPGGQPGQANPTNIVG